MMSAQPEHRRSGATPEENAAGDVSLAPKGGHAAAHDHQLRQRLLHIRITDVETRRLKVAVTLPVGLVGVAMRLGARLLPPSYVDGDLRAAIERGELESPIIVDDEENGERIEISLER